MVKSDRNSKKLFIILKKISPDLNEVRNFSSQNYFVFFSVLSSWFTSDSNKITYEVNINNNR